MNAFNYKDLNLKFVRPEPEKDQELDLSMPALLDPVQLAEYLGIGEKAARNIMKRSGFPKVLVGTRHKAILHLVDDWLASQINQDITRG